MTEAHNFRCRNCNPKNNKLSRPIYTLFFCLDGAKWMRKKGPWLSKVYKWMKYYPVIWGLFHKPWHIGSRHVLQPVPVDATTCDVFCFLYNPGKIMGICHKTTVFRKTLVMLCIPNLAKNNKWYNYLPTDSTGECNSRSSPRPPSLRVSWWPSSHGRGSFRRRWAR